MQYRTLLTLSLILAFLSSCVKETVIERTPNPARIADQNIDNSIKTDSTHNTLILTKDSLNKAFLLMPSYNSTNRTPMPAYLKPMVISFEKAGNRVAIYNLTDEQLYSTLDSNRLLQTFTILSETENEIRIDLDKGFTSLNSKETLGVIEKDSFFDMQAKMESGEETSIEVKDSVVKNIFQRNNSIFIQQNMRLKIENLKERNENPYKHDSKKIQYLENAEVTQNHTFELKPYVINSQFIPKTHDKEQKVGYFLNFRTQSQTDETVPLITAWDINDSRGPITVRFSDSTPENVRPALNEGIIYWNRVIGKDIFKIGDSFKKDEVQGERTLFVYWLPWKTAGFAMAGFQPDPLTGEIIKAHVIFTSSWLNAAKGITNPVNSKLEKPAHYHCLLEQAQLGSASSVNNVDKATTDILRYVMAHEVGHVLGLRHNFAGSSTTTHSDLELQQALQLYEAGKESNIPLNTTVMDYTLISETAASGLYIKNGILKYDQAAIDWAYLNKSTTLAKYEYCSDEHLRTASGYEKNIYGCERGDRYKNIYKFALEEAIKNLQNQVSKSFYNLIENIKTSRNSYYNKDLDLHTTLSHISYTSLEYSQFEQIAYSNISKKYVSIKSVIDNFRELLTYNTINDESAILEMANKHAAEIGGLPGVLNPLVELQRKSGNSFYKNQVEIFFKNLQQESYQEYLTEAELKQVKEKMEQAAIEGDKKLIVNIVQMLPIRRKSFTYDEATKQSKEETLVINTGFTQGFSREIIELYYEIYKSHFNEKTRKITANGIELDYTVPEANLWYSSYDVIINAFETSNAELALEKEKFKQVAVKNTLEILKAFSVNPVAPLRSTSLNAQIDSLDWTKISGLSKYDLQQETRELKKWEDLK